MLPDNLFYEVKDLARDEATSLWGYAWGGRLMEPNDSEYRKVNRELNRLLKRIQKDHGEDALDEALDAVEAVQHDIQADAYKRDRRKLPEPKRPRWASSRKIDPAVEEIIALFEESEYPTGRTDLDAVFAALHRAEKRDPRAFADAERIYYTGARKASRSLTSADRSALIRLASSMERGSEERRAILAGLKVAD